MGTASLLHAILDFIQKMILSQLEYHLPSSDPEIVLKTKSILQQPLAVPQEYSKPVQGGVLFYFLLPF